jgi:hypothetical protein
MRKIGRYPHKPQLKPFSSAKTRQDRVVRAREWLRMNPTRWARTVFTDEKEFDTNTTRAPSPVLLPRPAGNDPRRIKCKPTAAPVKVKLWAAISPKGIIAHTFFDKTLTAPTYKDILRKELLPAVKKALPHKPGWIFQQDNAPAHTADVITDFLETKEVDVLYWPPPQPGPQPH